MEKSAPMNAENYSSDYSTSDLFRSRDRCCLRQFQRDAVSQLVLCGGLVCRRGDVSVCRIRAGRGGVG